VCGGLSLHLVANPHDYMWRTGKGLLLGLVLEKKGHTLSNPSLHAHVGHRSSADSIQFPAGIICIQDVWGDCYSSGGLCFRHTTVVG